ncbi:glutathione peroxidase [Zoogloea sp.]|uniref:glutathione peroxidase n=1 Tax=Zoogloea sp. TaxID=49181 RepID=UPI0026028A0C|nr:glutathione peroxidase [Zoogloea sp.]MDD3352297.1 glutathione peroxidase [Zoogloea sp.]
MSPSSASGIFQTLLLLLFLGAGSVQAACPGLLNHSFPRLQDDKTQNLCDYQGKVLLVVNTASYCGFTSQYDGLEKMYARYKDKGLVVVGFPSNDFGNQEPGSSKEIADFCRLTYGVKFPMMAKTEVGGSAANPFYRQLASITGERPRWNFHKYLIDRSGQKVMSFPSTTAPDSRTLVNAVEKALAERPQ